MKDEYTIQNIGVIHYSKKIKQGRTKSGENHMRQPPMDIKWKVHIYDVLKSNIKYDTKIKYISIF